MVRTPSTMVPLGTPAPDFALPDTVSGDTVTRDGAAGEHGLLVAFICNHCPFVKHIREGLADFGRDYGERGLGIVAVSANDPEAYPDDAPERMAEEAREAGYPFPYLFDEAQEVALAYRAACTPDFFLFDGDLELVYRGQFDASRPGNGRPVTGEDLRAAADAVIEGREPLQEQVPSIGCNIKWREGNAPPWFGD